jgi:hypothetical protein
MMGTFKTERRQRAVYERQYKHMFPTFEAWRDSIEASRKRRATAEQRYVGSSQWDDEGSFEDWSGEDIQDPAIYD